MIGDAVFSPDERYRYRLSRVWDPGKPSLMWIMCNPSTATATKEDPTIRRCIGFSLNAGYGGMEIFNLFAYRSTDKTALLRVSNPAGTPENDHYILKGAANGRTIICAWGVPYKKLAYRVAEVLFLLKGLKLSCLAISDEGYPKHPLYLPAKSSFIPLNRFVGLR